MTSPSVEESESKVVSWGDGFNSALFYWARKSKLKVRPSGTDSSKGWEEDDPTARFGEKVKYTCWGVIRDWYSGWVWRKFKIVLKFSSV